MNIRVNMDATGHLRSRRLPIGDAARVGRTVLQRKEEILKAVGERGRFMVEPHLAALERHVPLMEQAVIGRTEDIPAPIEAPEVVRSLIRAEVELTNSVLFNHLIDFYVGGVEDGLSAAMAGPRFSDRVQSARSLHQKLFSQGKEFLRLSSLRQWHHVHVAFNLLSDADLDLARKAGVAEQIGWVQALNAYFARMLRINLDDIDALLDNNPELDNDPSNDDLNGALSDTLDALTSLAVVAGALWPAPSQGDLRIVLCGPYLDEIRRQSELHGQRVRDGRSPSP